MGQRSQKRRGGLVRPGVDVPGAEGAGVRVPGGVLRGRRHHADDERHHLQDSLQLTLPRW